MKKNSNIWCLLLLNYNFKLIDLDQKINKKLALDTTNLLNPNANF